MTRVAPFHWYGLYCRPLALAAAFAFAAPVYLLWLQGSLAAVIGVGILVVSEVRLHRCGIRFDSERLVYRSVCSHRVVRLDDIRRLHVAHLSWTFYGMAKYPRIELSDGRSIKLLTMGNPDRQKIEPFMEDLAHRVRARRGMVELG